MNYQVFLRTDEGSHTWNSPTTTVENLDDTEATISDLESGTTYCITVVARGPAGLRTGYLTEQCAAAP